MSSAHGGCECLAKRGARAWSMPLVYMKCALAAESGGGLRICRGFRGRPHAAVVFLRPQRGVQSIRRRWRTVCWSYHVVRFQGRVSERALKAVTVSYGYAPQDEWPRRSRLDDSSICVTHLGSLEMESTPSKIIGSRDCRPFSRQHRAGSVYGARVGGSSLVEQPMRPRARSPLHRLRGRRVQLWV